MGVYAPTCTYRFPGGVGAGVMEHVPDFVLCLWEQHSGREIMCCVQFGYFEQSSRS